MMFFVRTDRRVSSEFYPGGSRFLSDALSRVSGKGMDGVGKRVWEGGAEQEDERFSLGVTGSKCRAVNHAGFCPPKHACDSFIVGGKRCVGRLQGGGYGWWVICDCLMAPAPTQKDDLYFPFLFWVRGHGCVER